MESTKEMEQVMATKEIIKETLMEAPVDRAVTEESKVTITEIQVQLVDGIREVQVLKDTITTTMAVTIINLGDQAQMQVPTVSLQVEAVSLRQIPTVSQADRIALQLRQQMLEVMAKCHVS